MCMRVSMVFCPGRPSPPHIHAMCMGGAVIEVLTGLCSNKGVKIKDQSVTKRKESKTLRETILKNGSLGAELGW